MTLSAWELIKGTHCLSLRLQDTPLRSIYLEPVWEIEVEDSSLGEDVIEALDVDARATRPDGQDRPEDEALSVRSDG